MNPPVKPKIYTNEILETLQYSQRLGTSTLRCSRSCSATAALDSMHLALERKYTPSRSVTKLRLVLEAQLRLHSLPPPSNKMRDSLTPRTAAVGVTSNEKPHHTAARALREAPARPVYCCCHTPGATIQHRSQQTIDTWVPLGGDGHDGVDLSHHLFGSTPELRKTNPTTTAAGGTDREKQQRGQRWR